MVILDPSLIFALAALVTALSTMIWAIRRKP